MKFITQNSAFIIHNLHTTISYGYGQGVKLCIKTLDFRFYIKYIVIMNRKKSLIILALILALGLASVGGLILMNHENAAADCILSANQNFDCGSSLMPSATSHIKMFDALTQVIFSSPFINALLAIFLILLLVLFCSTLFELPPTRQFSFIFNENLARPRGPSYLRWLALLENSPSLS